MTTFAGKVVGRTRAAEHDRAEECRRRCVATPLAPARPASPRDVPHLRRRPRRTRRARSDGVPVTIARVTTDSPPTCDSGKAGQPHVVARRRRAAPTWPRAEAATASWVSTTPAGDPWCRSSPPRVRRPSSTPCPSRRVQALLVDQPIGRDRGEDRLAGCARQASVERERRVAGVPDPPQGVDEIGRRRAGRSQQGAARSEGYGDGRESVDTRRSAAHAPGRGRARGDRRRCGGRRTVAGVVAGRPGACRQPGVAGRRQLRQRLQRRRYAAPTTCASARCGSWPVVWPSRVT